ncbi:hypothetical protein FBU30_004906 [Linnemannia zychae]|nr:hypothetical protein FBU30_004906 [Linnemannia zychae]
MLSTRFSTTFTATATPISRRLQFFGSRTIRSISKSNHFNIKNIETRAMTTAAASTPTTLDPQGRRVHAEWEPHQRILMSWPTRWGGLTLKYQGDIARVAQAISKFEDIQMLVPPSHLDEARKMVGEGQGLHRIEFLPIPVDDLWARDFTPMYLTRPKEGGGNELVGVDYNFNGWGDKVPHQNMSRASERLIDYWNTNNNNAHVTRIISKMVTEGGAVESDGQGTLMMTESSVVNDNRNPNKTRAQLEKTFQDELGIQKVIWIKGLKGYDITDSHIDALARFVAPGVVMISRPPPKSETQGLFHTKRFQAWREQYDQAISVLSSATDARGQPIRIIDIPEPMPSKTRRVPPEEVKMYQELGVQECEPDGSGGINTYLNFLIVNGGVVMPQFGDEEADAEAKRIIEEFFEGREVVSVSIDYLVKGGGGIHCSTHDVPAI